MKSLKVSLVLALALLIVGCATTNLPPDASNDWKWRAGVSDAITGFDIGLTGVAGYLAIDPTKKPLWRDKGKKLALAQCEVLDQAIIMGKNGGVVDPAQIAIQITGLIVQIYAIINAPESYAKETKADMKAKRVARAVVEPPTWDVLSARVAQLRVKIQGM